MINTEEARGSSRSPRRSRSARAVAVAELTTAPSTTSTATGRKGAGESQPRARAAGAAVYGSITVRLVDSGADLDRRGRSLEGGQSRLQLTVEGPGTGDGFKRFCAGETDISDASRKIKPEGEADACKSAGIQYVELPIAYDGITVMTSPQNSTVECLSFADLYALIGPESQGFTTWDAAQSLATELGSKVTYPKASLDITGPGEESGTFDSFVELALAGIAGERGKDATTRPDYVASPNDNTIIENVAGSESSLGWVGFAFAEENKDTVKEVAVSKDPGGECLAPSADTIADGSYPISRTLYIYVNKAKAAENPAVRAYVDFYLAEGTISSVLETVPYVNLPTEDLAASRSTWDATE